MTAAPLESRICQPDRRTPVLARALCQSDAELAGSADGPVYRLGARLPSHGVVAPYTGGEILFGNSLTRHHIGHRYAAGARIFARPVGGIPGHSDLLFLVRANGILAPVTQTSTPPPEEGDTMILLSPATAES